MTELSSETLRVRLESLGLVAVALGGLKAGGCCVYAAIVGIELAKLGIPVCGVIASDIAPGTLDQLRPAENFSVHAWNATGLRIDHVGLEVELDGELWLVDAGGVVPQTAGAYLGRAPDCPLVPGYLSLEEVVRLSLDDSPGAWVEDFDRRNIPALRRLAAEMLTD